MRRRLQRHLARSPKSNSHADLPWPAQDGLSDEGLVKQRLRKLHPQYARYGPGDEIVENGKPMSPTLHLLMHEIVENQLRDEEPAFVSEAVARLEARGLDPHEARHAIASALVGEIYQALSNKTPHDEEAYRQRVASAEAQWLKAHGL